MKKKLCSLGLAITMALTLTACSIPFLNKKDEAPVQEEEAAPVETINDNLTYNIGDIVKPEDLLNTDPAKVPDRVYITDGQGTEFTEFECTEAGELTLLVTVLYQDMTDYQNVVHITVVEPEPEVISVNYPEPLATKVLDGSMKNYEGNGFKFASDMQVIVDGDYVSFMNPTSDVYDPFLTGNGTDLTKYTVSANLVSEDFFGQFNVNSGYRKQMVEGAFLDGGSENTSYEIMDVDGNMHPVTAYYVVYNGTVFGGDVSKIYTAYSFTDNDGHVLVYECGIQDLIYAMLTPEDTEKEAKDYTKWQTETYPNGFISADVTTVAASNVDTIFTTLKDSMLIGELNIESQEVTVDNGEGQGEVPEGEVDIVLHGSTYAELHPEIYNWPENRLVYRRWIWTVTEETQYVGIIYDRETGEEYIGNGTIVGYTDNPTEPTDNTHTGNGSDALLVTASATYRISNQANNAYKILSSESSSSSVVVEYDNVKYFIQPITARGITSAINSQCLFSTNLFRDGQWSAYQGDSKVNTYGEAQVYMIRYDETGSQMQVSRGYFATFKVDNDYLIIKSDAPCSEEILMQIATSMIKKD